MAYEDPPAAEDSSAAPPTGTGVQYVEVAVDDAGQRLDNFLTRYLKDVPRTHIFRLLRKGEVRVNKKRAKPDQRVVVGDQVRIPPLRRAGAMPAPTEPRPASASLQKLVLDAIISRARELAFEPSFKSTSIVHGELGPYAAAAGAALLAGSTSGK